MNNSKTIITLLMTFVISISGCTNQAFSQKGEGQAVPLTQLSDLSHTEENLELIKDRLITKYQATKPQEWGYTEAAKVKFATKEKVVALTLDACGGSKLSNGYDRELIDFLKGEKIPAALFISGNWMKTNPELVEELAQNPLFTIENHGQQHRPLSINGKKAYNITGTGSIAEAVEEVEVNAREIRDITGRKPRFYRSGTAYYDDVAVRIVGELGYQAVNFNVIGDAGATFTKAQVAKALTGIKPGSIVILHMNHPEGQTAEGVQEGVHALQAKGFRFVRLDEYALLSDGE